MRLPRDLTGRELANSLIRELGYRQVHQRGSHIFETGSPVAHRIGVPAHSPLHPGALNATCRAVDMPGA
jgi:predicted RNA binding protein YcfA (HicA-like mRNA interferase family)